MKLWVLRHGEAQNQASTDSARELTRRGRAQVVQSAAHLLGAPLDAIFASPYVRAQQTAALVHEALGFARPVITVPWLTPEQSPHEVSSQLQALGLENVLLVSHQPLVGNLIGLLESGSDVQDHPMATASLAELDGDQPAPASMRITSLRHP